MSLLSTQVLERFYVSATAVHQRTKSYRALREAGMADHFGRL
jgi:hypothetical protein